MIDAEWAALGTAVGGAIGASSSIVTTWLNARLTRSDADAKYDAAAKDLLKRKLVTGDQWQSVKELANIIGLDEKTTKEYLILLGARGSEKDGTRWGLLTRNPI